MKHILFLLLVTICTMTSMSPSTATIAPPQEDLESPCPIAGGSVFISSAGVLTDNHKISLNSLVADMLNNPACKVIVVGGGKGNKIEQQISWENVNAVINYLVDVRKIDRERFIFQHSGDAPVGTVDYRAAGETEDGPSSVPPPFPNSH